MEINRVYEKLNKVELKAEKVELALASEKIELGAVDDLIKKYKKIAANAPKIKNIILKEANNLAAVATSLGTIKAQFDKIEKTAKELGVDLPNEIKSVGNVSQSLAKEWGKAANNISNSAKEI